MVRQNGTGSFTCFEVIASTAKMHVEPKVGCTKIGNEQAVVRPPQPRLYPTLQSQIGRHLGPSMPHSSFDTPRLSFIKLASTLMDDRDCHCPTRRFFAFACQGVHLPNSIEIPVSLCLRQPSTHFV